MPDVIKDSSGKVVRTRDVDDRGERFPIFQVKPAACLGIVGFTEVFRLNIVRARRGQLILTLDLNADVTTAAFINAWLDVRIVGWVGGAGQILDFFTLDRFGMADFSWDDPESYEAISVEVQQNIDGINTATAPGLRQMNLNVGGAYWR